MLSHSCVKSNPQTGDIRSDLEKIGKLRQIGMENENRFHHVTHGDFTVFHQILCLIYDQTEHINSDTFYNILTEDLGDWDLVLRVDKDELIVRSSLPYASEIEDSSFAQKSNSDDILVLSHGMLNFITFLSMSLPITNLIDNTGVFSSLMNRYQG